MTDNVRPMLEIVLQESPVFGWVIMANWPTGKVEQLVGVYTTREAAEEWLAERYEAWIALQETGPGDERSGCKAEMSAVHDGAKPKTRL